MSFVDLFARGAQVPEHNRLKGLDHGNPHPQYAATTHGHDPTGDAGNEVLTYATGGIQITYDRVFTTAPVPNFNIEAPSGGRPHACYIADATTTGFKAIIYTSAGTEATAGGAYRIFWHATPEGG